MAFGNKKPTGALTYIGEGSVLDGDLRTSGNARVDGKVTGSLYIEGDLEVGVTGHITGNEVKAKNVVVLGQIFANVVAAGRLHIAKNARVEGDTKSTSLDVEVGAVFLGRSQTGGEPKALPQGVKQS